MKHFLDRLFDFLDSDNGLILGFFALVSALAYFGFSACPR